ncbi:hypothetical protein [Sphingomonas sp.]|uniref:hypothetical protein n=1 Tax=Sphingomonas sp. TaxID=28214 RepID=UPI003AFFE7A2
MRDAKDAAQMVRTDLCRRLERLEAALAARGPIGLAAEAAEIGAIAGEHGFRPAVRLAEGLAVALESGGRGAAVGPWIERLRDAIGCEAADTGAETSWLSSVVVRLTG